jgi:hypothetical protein
MILPIPKPGDQLKTCILTICRFFYFPLVTTTGYVDGFDKSQFLYYKINISYFNMFMLYFNI